VRGALAIVAREGRDVRVDRLPAGDVVLRAELLELRLAELLRLAIEAPRSVSEATEDRVDEVVVERLPLARIVPPRVRAATVRRPRAARAGRALLALVDADHAGDGVARAIDLDGQADVVGEVTRHV